MTVAASSAGKSREITVGWLADLLLHNGFIDEKQRSELDNVDRQNRLQARARRGEESPSVFHAIASLNLIDSSGQGTRIDESLMARLVAEEAGLPFFRIDPLRLDIDLIETKISRPFAKKHKLIPIQIRDGKLVIAVVNPFDVASIESYRTIAGLDLELVVSAESEVMRVVNEFYGLRALGDESRARPQERVRPRQSEQYVKLNPAPRSTTSDQAHRQCGRSPGQHASIRAPLISTSSRNG